MTKATLRRLAYRWRKKSMEYSDAVRRERAIGGEPCDIGRYEGESIALRWCAEDLEKGLQSKWAQVREWYQVVNSDGYIIGHEHLQIEKAVEFLKTCLKKSKGKGWRIKHFVTESIDVDLQQFDDVEI